VSFSLHREIIGYGSLRLQSEDRLCDFIRTGTKMNPKMFHLFELVRFEYCSTDVIDDFLDLLSEHYYEINASMRGSLRARLVLPNVPRREFPPSVRKGNSFDLPDGIIAHLTGQCGGNVHDRQVVDVTRRSFEKDTQRANPYSGHLITIPVVLQRTLLIWKLVHVSFQLIATVGKISRTRGTIGCATISRRGGLCQLTTQSARMTSVRAILI
jgi:hypothetical protein